MEKAYLSEIILLDRKGFDMHVSGFFFKNWHLINEGHIMKHLKYDMQQILRLVLH